MSSQTLWVSLKRLNYMEKAAHTFFMFLLPSKMFSLSELEHVLLIMPLQPEPALFAFKQICAHANNNKDS